jgi:HEXXH motif-containing protein
LIAHHELPESAFAALASGVAGPGVIRCLQEAQQSKHAMLLYAIAEAADGTGPGPSAFRAGYDLLTRVQRVAPAGAAWLLNLPHLGSWIHDCLIRLEQGTEPDLAYLACAAAAAAVRAGVPFELDVPLRDDRVLLPGLGSVHVTGQGAMIRLRCDGERVTAGQFEASRDAVVPDDGSSEPVRQWSGTPMIRTVIGGLEWSVLLETTDLYLDRYPLPMAAGMLPGDIDRWRQRIRSAWEILVQHHRSTAEPIAAGVSVMVPLMSRSDDDLVSATSPAAFGAIATSWPPDPVTLAETLVHEFQHVKLCGLMDMIPLVEPGGPRVYAPWRQDPRPVGGLLQGLSAHIQIARFWHVQQHVAAEPDDVFHAQTSFARWRSTIGVTVRTLQESGCLTVAGQRFADLIRQEGEVLEAEYLPDVPQQIAEEISLDHWLTWQVRHVATDPGGVASLAAAYRRGMPFREHAPVKTWIAEDTRKVASDKRSRMLNLCYLSPARHREVRSTRTVELSEADDHLISGRTSAAVQSYREQIAGSADPQPDAWIGLALALHRLGAPSPGAAPATDLALLFDVHTSLVHTSLGEQPDPLDLASWFA